MLAILWAPLKTSLRRVPCTKLEQCKRQARLLSFLDLVGFMLAGGASENVVFP